MTDAELKVVREWLGLSGDWLAGHLGVSPRTVRHWEYGRHPIPDGVRLAVEALEQTTEDFVSGVAAQLVGVPDAVVITYRNDAEYHAAHPEVVFPASWHRAATVRVARRVPGLVVVYGGQVER